MGHKVNPIIFRIGPLTTWTSRWFASKNDFQKKLHEDVVIRKFLKTRLRQSGIDKIFIERTREHLTITIHAAKPGMIIGRGGTGIEELRRVLLKDALMPLKRQLYGKGSPEDVLAINVVEVAKPNLSASIVLEQLIAETERRIPFRKSMKQAIDRVMKAGALGVRITMGGRLNGAEIARSETLSVGKIPLHTLRADIDYSRGTAHTIYGSIGIKVWIYRGEIFTKE